MSTAIPNHAQRSPVLMAAKRLPLPAFFCNEAKRPTCPNGFYDACQGEALEELHRRHPGPLVGVPTGSGSGFSVLDIDTPKGGGAWWAENKDKLPQTRLHETRSGGIHALFGHRAGLKCSTSKIAPGVDVRGELGYVIWWPANGFSVVDHPLAPWPDWLQSPEPEPQPPRFTLPTGPISLSRYGRAALDRACAAISGAANGDQEATLNRECFSLGQLVAGSVIESTIALSALLSAAHSMTSYDSRRPWTVREIDAKVSRSFDEGQRRPRTPVRRVG